MKKIINVFESIVAVMIVATFMLSLLLLPGSVTYNNETGLWEDEFDFEFSEQLYTQEEQTLTQKVFGPIWVTFVSMDRDWDGKFPLPNYQRIIYGIFFFVLFCLWGYLDKSFRKNPNRKNFLGILAIGMYFSTGIIYFVGKGFVFN